MADKNTTIDESRAWTDRPETVNFAHLIMMCQAFQNKVIEYYKAAAPPKRPARLIAIRDELTRIKFTDGTHTFTIAPDGQGNCPDGQKPVDGFCAATE